MFVWKTFTLGVMERWLRDLAGRSLPPPAEPPLSPPPSKSAGPAR